MSARRRLHWKWEHECESVQVGSLLLEVAPVTGAGWRASVCVIGPCTTICDEVGARTRNKSLRAGKLAALAIARRHVEWMAAHLLALRGELESMRVDATDAKKTKARRG